MLSQVPNWICFLLGHSITVSKELLIAIRLLTELTTALFQRNHDWIESKVSFKWKWLSLKASFATALHGSALQIRFWLYLERFGGLRLRKIDDFVMTLRFTKQAPAAPQLNYNTNICLGANRNFGYFEASVYNASYRIYMLHLDEIQDDCLFRTLVARVCFGMSSSWNYQLNPLNAQTRFLEHGRK